MTVLPPILAFLAGLLIGSFLNVCVFRLPRDLSVMRPARSFCPACERTIAWYDNIPLLSYVLLHGRCRQCREWISVRYPLVELATGVAFAVCAAAFGLTASGLKYAVFSALVIGLIATDMEERILPDEFTLGGTLIGLATAAFVPLGGDVGRVLTILLHLTWGQRWISVAESAIGAAVSSGAIWLVGWVYLKLRHREGLGLGDVKMIAMIGAFLGLEEALVTLILASVLGSVAGLAYIFIQKKDASTYELPFGSFLGVASLAVAVYGKLRGLS